MGVCQLLVNNGAPLTTENKQHRTPKQEAQMKRHADLVDYLQRKELGIVAVSNFNVVFFYYLGFEKLHAIFRKLCQMYF